MLIRTGVKKSFPALKRSEYANSNALLFAKSNKYRYDRRDLSRDDALQFGANRDRLYNASMLLARLTQSPAGRSETSRMNEEDTVSFMVVVGSGTTSGDDRR